MIQYLLMGVAGLAIGAYAYSKLAKANAKLVAYKATIDHLNTTNNDLIESLAICQGILATWNHRHTADELLRDMLADDVDYLNEEDE